MVSASSPTTFSVPRFGLSGSTLVLVAGPKGSGTKTFLNAVLRELAEAFPFVNPDAVSLSRRERA